MFDLHKTKPATVGYWKNADGVLIPVTKLTDRHIMNIRTNYYEYGKAVWIKSRQDMYDAVRDEGIRRGLFRG